MSRFFNQTHPFSLGVGLVQLCLYGLKLANPLPVGNGQTRLGAKMAAKTSATKTITSGLGDTNESKSERLA